MTNSRKLFFTFFILFISVQVFSQDTVIVATDYKYKFGAKLISERSTDYKYSDESFGVFGGGLQVTRKIKKTNSSFESGLYLVTKASQYRVAIGPCVSCSNFLITVNYHYLSIPVNYRIDTKIFYFSMGFFADYLLNQTNDDPFYFTDIENYGTDRKFQIGYNANIGFEKSFSYRMSVFAEARLAITLSSAKTDGGFFLNSGNIGHSNANYGFGIGTNYKL